MPFIGPTSASKATVASLAGSLRQELAPWDVHVVVVEPASIRTAAGDKLGDDTRRNVESFSPDGRELCRSAYERMIGTFLTRESKGSPPEVVATRSSALSRTAPWPATWSATTPAASRRWPPWRRRHCSTRYAAGCSASPGRLAYALSGGRVVI